MQQRLHVIMAKMGIASRRKAESLILAGKVSVNGKLVKTLGMQFDPAKDQIKVNGELLSKTKTSLRTFMMYKPVSTVSTVSDPDGKRTVLDIFARWFKNEYPDQDPPRVWPVGRLDEASEGLILLTNDGESAYRLTHPKFEVEKIYHILVAGAPTNTQLTSLQKGARLKEGFSQVDQVSIVKHEAGNTWIALTIHQGLHRQVRRTCARVGLEILRLVRVKMGGFELGSLPSGQIQEIIVK